MQRFTALFRHANTLPPTVGMVHVAATPGAPTYGGCVRKIIDGACRDAEIHLKSGISGILMENMHDVPYIQSKDFGPEVVATMSAVAAALRKIVPENVPLGIQVLACGNKEAIAIAHANAFDFVRAEGFVFSHIADEGFTDANAGALLRYRKQIGADNVLVFADIKKKHSSHSITGDISLEETAKAAEYFLADGLIVTGNATGDPAKPTDVEKVKTTVSLPVIVGSGVNYENVQSYLKADALIVGSHFKKDGVWFKELQEERIKRFVHKINILKNN